MSSNRGTYRETLLQVVAEYAKSGSSFQSGLVLREAAKRLQINRNVPEEQALLTLWGDLFRQGLVAWGYDLNNAEAPFCHLTDRGRTTLEGVGRDPANPSGYLAALQSAGQISSLADAYIREALVTYNAGCVRATGVMVGAATEALIIDLRDAMVARITVQGRRPSAKLSDWRAKTVLDAIADELRPHVRLMGKALQDRYQYHWPGCTQQIRASRNDAGHPGSATVTEDDVHAALLLFPEVVKMANGLTAWITHNLP